MAKPVSKVRREWTRRVIAALTPLVQKGEYLSRRGAIKLIEPSSDWQRRELERIRLRGNAVARGEESDPLWYSHFGVSLQSPLLRDTGIEQLVTETTPSPEVHHRSLPGLAVCGVVNELSDIYAKICVEGHFATHQPVEGEMYLLKDGGVIYVVSDGFVVTGKDLMAPDNIRGTLYSFMGVEQGPCVLTIAEPLYAPSYHDLTILPEEEVMQKTRVVGDCYVNRLKRIMVWDGTDWTDCGAVTRDLGYVVDDEGVRAMSTVESISHYLGHPAKVVGCFDCQPSKLPSNPNKGDIWGAIGDIRELASYTPEVKIYHDVFWDGTHWRKTTPPFKLVYELLGCSIKPVHVPLVQYIGSGLNFHNTIFSIDALPKSPSKGDVYPIYVNSETRFDNSLLNDVRELFVVWDGAKWVLTQPPYRPLSEVWTLESQLPRNAEPEYNPAANTVQKKPGFMRRVLNSIGLK